MPALLSLLPSELVLPEAPAGATLEQHLACASRPFLVVRVAVALLAALLPLLTFAAARFFLGGRAALLAAALVALSLLHLVYSQQARPHVPHATLAWLTLLALMRLVERPDPRRLVLSATALGLAMGTLQSALLLLPPALVAAACAWSALARRRWMLLALPLAAALGLLAFSPAPAISEAGVLLAPGGHAIRFANLSGAGAAQLFAGLWGYDPLLCLLGVLGGVLLVISGVRHLRAPRPGAPLWVLLAYVLPSVLLLLLNSVYRNRYALPLLPALAILSAWAVARLARGLGPRRGWVALPLSVALLVLPALNAARYLQLRLRPDTRQQAARWLEARPPGEPRRAVVARVLVLPTLLQPHGVEGERAPFPGGRPVWLAYQQDHLPDLPGGPLELRMFPIPMTQADAHSVRAWLDEQPASWFVLQTDEYLITLPGLVVLRELLAQRSAPAAVFAGEDPERWPLLGIDYLELPQFTQHLWLASSFGPRLEVYRWTPDGR